MSLGRVFERSKVRVAVVKLPSIPFGWKVIPLTADAASVTLWVNLECLNIHFTLNRSVTNTEPEGVNGADPSICLDAYIQISLNDNRFVGFSFNSGLLGRSRRFLFYTYTILSRSPPYPKCSLLQGG